MPIDTKAVFAEVQNNSARLSACKQHRFAGGKPVLGGKNECLECGGKLGNTDVLYYVAGYEAGGGSADDIWPGWHARGSKSES